MPFNNNSGAKDGVTAVTSTVGNTVGGLTNTVGGIVGAAGRGVGSTVNNATGTKAAGDSLAYITDGVENGASSLAKGAENAGKMPGK